MYGTSLAGRLWPQVLLNARRSRPNAAPCITDGCRQPSIPAELDSLGGCQNLATLYAHILPQQQVFRALLTAC